MTHSSTPLDIDTAGQDDLSGNQDSSPSAVSIPPMQDLDAAEPKADPWDTQTETTVGEGVEEITSGVTAQSSQSEHSTSTTSTQSSSWAESPALRRIKRFRLKLKPCL